MLDLYGASSAFNLGLRILTNAHKRSWADQRRSRTANDLFVDFRDRSTTAIVGRTSESVPMVTMGRRRFGRVLDLDVELLCP